MEQREKEVRIQEEAEKQSQARFVNLDNLHFCLFYVFSFNHVVICPFPFFTK